MTEEEFEKIKEAEKEKLRAQKKLRKLKQTLRRRQSIRGAVRRMAEGAHSVLSRSTEWMDTLASETARQQARLEVALEAIEDDADLTTDADVTTYEAEGKAARAKELIRQMKQQGTASSASRSKTSSRNEDASGSSSSGATDSTTPSSTSDDDLPEKTLGRMR